MTNNHGKAPPPAPRWVKALLAIGLVIAIIIAVILLMGGEHGPGRHTGRGEPAKLHQAVQTARVLS